MAARCPNGYAASMQGYFSSTYSTMRRIVESEERIMNEVCGNCKYNKRDFSKPQNSGYAEFCCGNEDSENYGVPTMYDDTCDDYEEKE